MTTTIQDEFNTRTLKVAKQVQEYAVDAIKAVGERVQPVLPKLDRIPGIANVPTATEVVEKAFQLSNELLKSAKVVAIEATKAFSLRDGRTSPAQGAKPVAKKAPAAATATADAAS